MSTENLRQSSDPEIILPEECLTLSPVCQEGVKDVLDRLQRMEESGSWFKKRTPEELNLLIPQAQEHAQGIFDGLRQYKNADNSWGEALDTAGGTAWNAAWDTAGGTAWDTAWDAAGGAARAAAWEVVKDFPGFETNPFSPFLCLYELGSAGIKFHQVEKTNKEPEEMLTVHFPLKLKDNPPVLACLTFPDGRPGDETVLSTHSWQDPCSQITLLSPPTQREIK